MYLEGQTRGVVNTKALFFILLTKVKDALDILDCHCDPLVPDEVSRVSVSGLMVLTAEDIRDEGLPEWMQVRT